MTVVKDLKPGDDPGRFDLKVGDEVVKAQAGDGDAGSKSVAPGDYTVSEAGETLAKYDSSVACDNGQSGDGSSLAGRDGRFQRRRDLHDHQHAPARAR